MIAYIPKPNFVPVAISSCRLNCKHCMGKYLEGMVKICTPDELIKFGEGFKGNGLLISGGFDKNGKLINLEKMIPAIKKLNIYVAIHPGFAGEIAEEIAEACNIAFVDLPSKNAIKNVFGLEASVEEYFKNMELLIDAGIKVSPHVTAGLNYGKIEEWEIIDELKSYKFEKLVLNFIVPTTKTPFEKVRIDRQEAIEFIKEVKKKFSNIAIGCMRPRSLDVDLIKEGIKEMANPSKKAMNYAKEKGIRVEIRQYCCGIGEMLSHHHL